MMDRRAMLGAGVALPLVAGCARLASSGAHRIVRPSAPFAMPGIAVPDFTGSRRFAITDHGAAPGDETRTSAAIAAAIAAAHAAGSGIVVVPPGIWPTGPIHLKSNVALHVEDGATLFFSDVPADYLPAVASSWEGIECLNYSPLIYAHDCENVAITGRGLLKAKLDRWRAWYARPRPHLDALIALYQMARTGVPVAARDMTRGAANLRPQFIQFNRCRRVLVEDVAIEDSPFWTIHPFLCRDVVIRRVRIIAHGHNNDGVDPEMCERVLIEDCVFDQGDDAVSVKSGRDHDAWRLGTPSRDIVMRGCTMRNGHQLMAIGSELSAGIENVFVDDCHFDHAGSAVPSTITNLLFVKTNERRGGYVRNIHMRDVSATRIAGGVLSVDTDVLYQWRTLLPTYDRRLTPIEGLYVSGIRVGEAKFRCEIAGAAALPVRDVRLRDVSIGRVGTPAVTTRNVVGFVDAG